MAGCPACSAACAVVVATGDVAGFARLALGTCGCGRAVVGLAEEPGEDACLVPSALPASPAGRAWEKAEE